MDLKFLRDRRVVIAAAGGLVLIVGLGVGLMLKSPREAAPAVPASTGSLQVEVGKDDGVVESDRTLRCFVGGQFIGTDSLDDCARKNGVAPGGLDVGLDPSGAVAATTPDASVLQPLPSAPEPPPGASGDDGPSAPEQAAAQASAPAEQSGACWRFAGDWSKVADDMSLDACVQALFAGRCERPGGADYGRWNGDTLRLVTGRVERAGDNRTFHTLVEQGREDCAIPNIQE